MTSRHFISHGVGTIDAIHEDLDSDGVADLVHEDVDGDGARQTRPTPRETLPGPLLDASSRKTLASSRDA